MTNQTTSDYATFIQNKIQLPNGSGFEVDRAELHPSLKPHQIDCVVWALQKGRALLAPSFGLGKTRIEAALAQVIQKRMGGKVLQVVTLGVRHQFTQEDGPAMGIEYEYVRTDAEVEAATSNYLVTNYERIRNGNIDPRKHGFSVVCFDEGDFFRNRSSKTSDVFREVFDTIPYLFICTATPTPNEYREIIYYADFLGIMDSGQALTRWFQRNPDTAGDLQLQDDPKTVEAFWLWVSSWALFLDKPSTLGYSDEGYIMPEVTIRWHRLGADLTRAWEQVDSRGQHRLMPEGRLSSTAQSREAKATISDRLAFTIDLINASPDDHFILWHHLEHERREIERYLPEAKTVYGSQDLELREKLVLGFSRGEYRILATKPQIAGSGCNFQHHCHKAVFMGVNYKFREFIQAIHRLVRYLQTEHVEIDVVYAETEDAVVEKLKRSFVQHNELMANMRSIIQTYGLSHAAMKQRLQRASDVARRERIGHNWRLLNNDCVAELKDMPTNSVDMILTSIPFGNHYEYSASLLDFGHNPSDGDFWKQMRWLIPDLLRVLKPGRIAAIHVKDRIMYSHQTKSQIMEVAPFSAEALFAFRNRGFLYQGMITIVTDVVRENNSSYRLSYTEMCKDGSKMGVGLPEYVLLFRKAPTDTANSYADEPVVKNKADYGLGQWQIDAHSFWRSDGHADLYDYHAHVARLDHLRASGNLPTDHFCEPPVSYHSNVWTDVNFMQGLNMEQARRRLANHLCPLPFDIVRRLTGRYSQKGEIILDPFSGLGTVPYVALQMGRAGLGVELSNDYFDASVRYLSELETALGQPNFLDLVEEVA